MKKSAILTLLSCLWTLTLWAQLPPGSELKDYSSRQIDLNFQTRYFKSTGNFTKSGNQYDAIPAGYEFQNMQFDFAARSQIFDRFAMFAGLSVGSTQSSSPTISRTNSALSDATLGFDYLMSSGQLSLIPELRLSVPISTIDIGSDTPAVNDGAMTATGKMIALIKVSSSARVGAFAGFVYRDKGYSSLLPYGALIELEWTGVRLGADIRGYTSLGYDQASDNELPRETYFCRANGCSKKFAAINPALLESNAWIKIEVARDWDLYGGFGTTITGQSSAQGLIANLGFLYRWGLSSTPTTSGSAPRQRVTNPTFREEVQDGVDQELFKAPPLPPPLPPSPDAQRKKEQQQMQQDLNKTQMQIDLKPNKKKKRK